MAANNLLILVQGITWVKIQIDDQVVDRVGVVVTHGPVSISVPIVLGMNMLKDLLHFLAKFAGGQRHRRAQWFVSTSSVKPNRGGLYDQETAPASEGCLYT